MIIRVRVITNAEHSEVMGRLGSTVRVRVAAPTVDGNANQELVEFLSDFFEVKKGDVQILRGHKGKEKTVEIEGRPDHELEDAMDSIV